MEHSESPDPGTVYVPTFPKLDVGIDQDEIMVHDAGLPDTLFIDATHVGADNTTTQESGPCTNIYSRTPDTQTKGFVHIPEFPTELQFHTDDISRLHAELACTIIIHTSYEHPEEIADSILRTLSPTARISGPLRTIGIPPFVPHAARFSTQEVEMYDAALQSTLQLHYTDGPSQLANDCCLETSSMYLPPYPRPPASGLVPSQGIAPDDTARPPTQIVTGLHPGNLKLFTRHDEPSGSPHRPMNTIDIPEFQTAYHAYTTQEIQVHDRQLPATLPVHHADLFESSSGTIQLPQFADLRHGCSASAVAIHDAALGPTQRREQSQSSPNVDHSAHIKRESNDAPGIIEIPPFPHTDQPASSQDIKLHDAALSDTVPLDYAQQQSPGRTIDMQDDGARNMQPSCDPRTIYQPPFYAAYQGFRNDGITDHDARLPSTLLLDLGSPPRTVDDLSRFLGTSVIKNPSPSRQVDMRSFSSPTVGVPIARSDTELSATLPDRLSKSDGTPETTIVDGGTGPCGDAKPGLAARNTSPPDWQEDYQGFQNHERAHYDAAPQSAMTLESGSAPHQAREPQYQSRDGRLEAQAIETGPDQQQYVYGVFPQLQCNHKQPYEHTDSSVLPPSASQIGDTDVSDDGSLTPTSLRSDISAMLDTYTHGVGTSPEAQTQDPALWLCHEEAAELGKRCYWSCCRLSTPSESGCDSYVGGFPSSFVIRSPPTPLFTRPRRRQPREPTPQAIQVADCGDHPEQLEENPRDEGANGDSEEPAIEPPAPVTMPPPRRRMKRPQTPPGYVPPRTRDWHRRVGEQPKLKCESDDESSDEERPDQGFRTPTRPVNMNTIGESPIAWARKLRAESAAERALKQEAVDNMPSPIPYSRSGRIPPVWFREPPANRRMDRSPSITDSEMSLRLEQAQRNMRDVTPLLSIRMVTLDDVKADRERQLAIMRKREEEFAAAKAKWPPRNEDSPRR